MCYANPDNDGRITDTYNRLNHTITTTRPYGEHITLTCLHHTNLRWHTKNIDYIGARTIFFDWATTGGVECSCPTSDLVFLLPDADGSSRMLTKNGYVLLPQPHQQSTPSLKAGDYPEAQPHPGFRNEDGELPLTPAEQAFNSCMGSQRPTQADGKPS